MAYRTQNTTLYYGCGTFDLSNSSVCQHSTSIVRGFFIGAISEFTLMTVAQSIEQRRAKSQVGGTNRIPLSRENGFTTDYIALFFIKGECSKAGELVFKTDWVGSIPTALAFIEGFSLYPVSSKRESRYNEECVTENIAPGIIAHLALHRSGVLCKGALFLLWFSLPSSQPLNDELLISKIFWARNPRTFYNTKTWSYSLQGSNLYMESKTYVVGAST